MNEVDGVAIMISLGHTLTRKFTMLLLGFLALQIVQLVAGSYGIRHIGHAGGYVNEAGKQRARTLMLANLARQAITEKSRDKAQGALFRTMLGEYDAYFPRLNAFVSEFHTDDMPLNGIVTEARESWFRDMRPLIADLGTKSPSTARANLIRYETLSMVQIKRLDRIVSAIEDHIRAETRQLVVFQTVVVALSLLLGIIGLVMARDMVTRPLRRFIVAAQSIAGGAYEQRVSVVSRDEIGELADTFNSMAAAIAEKTARIEALNDIAVRLTSARALHELLDEVMQCGRQLSGAQAACVALYNEERGLFDRWITYELSNHFVNSMRFRSGGLADEALASGGCILSDDGPQNRHKLSQLARDEGIRAFICLPLVSHMSHLGVIYFYRKDRDYFLPDEIGILNTYAHLAAGAIESARLQEHTRDLAATDKLTGLRNRRMFDQRLEEEIARARRNDKPLSLLMLDVDDFKQINDTRGHVAGDIVLQSLGHALSELLWRADFPARYGGEEFAVILPETDWNGAKLVAERIRTFVAKMLPEALPLEYKVPVTVSIGVATFPDCGASSQGLIDRADQALYTAKREGKNCVRLYREILKAQLEQEPGRIVELLKRSLGDIPAIVTAVSAKADFYHQHADAVEYAAMHLAEILKLSPADKEALRLASRLHDVGMIVVADEVLKKRNELTPQERQIFEQHPSTGAKFLEQVPALSHLAPVVRHHHERYDGAGYPDGLKGEATPYLARVLAVADAYGSMTTDWLGNVAMSAAEAEKQLIAGAGTLFDPEIVSEFVATLDRAGPVVA